MNPASRPPAISRSPGAAGEPRVSPVMTKASVAPRPRPVSAAQASANLKSGLCAACEPPVRVVSLEDGERRFRLPR